MPIFHYLSNLFNPFFFLGLIFFFSHLFLIQQLQMINFQEALQIREKWKIVNCLLSRQRKIAQDKIAHSSIIQNNVVSPSPFLFFLFFFFQHILTFLVIRWLLSNWGLGGLKCIDLFLPKALFSFPKLHNPMVILCF